MSKVVKNLDTVVGLVRERTKGVSKICYSVIFQTSIICDEMIFVRMTEITNMNIAKKIVLKQEQK